MTADWERARAELAEVVRESTFAIWLDPIELIAIDPDTALVVAVPPATISWVRARVSRLLTEYASRAGRDLRFADEPERVALSRGQGRPAAGFGVLQINQKEVS